MKTAFSAKNPALLIAAMLLMALSSFARADLIEASWTQEIDFDPDVGIPPDFSYSHDLTLDGFRPLEDFLLGYDLTIELIDDPEDPRYGSREAARVDLPGILGDRLFFDVTGTEYGGWSLAGVLELNLNGTLSVTVSSLYGDFLLASSTLTGYGLSRRVPEPGTLALFALGLLGVAFVHRRRSSSKSSDR